MNNCKQIQYVLATHNFVRDVNPFLGIKRDLLQAMILSHYTGFYFSRFGGIIGIFTFSFWPNTSFRVGSLPYIFNNFCSCSLKVFDKINRLGGQNGCEGEFWREEVVVHQPKLGVPTELEIKHKSHMHQGLFTLFVEEGACCDVGSPGLRAEEEAFKSGFMA